MLTSTITRHVMEFGQAEITAKIAFNVVPACGDGWNEPREPAHAEVTGVALTLHEFVWRHDDAGSLKRASFDMAVPCPDWLERLIIADADCDLTYAVDELLADDRDRADEAYDMRRAAE